MNTLLDVEYSDLNMNHLNKFSVRKYSYYFYYLIYREKLTNSRCDVIDITVLCPCRN